MMIFLTHIPFCHLFWVSRLAVIHRLYFLHSSSLTVHKCDCSCTPLLNNNRPSFSVLKVIFKDQPLNNEHFSTTATFFESQGWLLYTGLNVLSLFFFFFKEPIPIGYPPTIRTSGVTARWSSRPTTCWIRMWSGQCSASGKRSTTWSLRGVPRGKKCVWEFRVRSEAA